MLLGSRGFQRGIDTSRGGVASPVSIFVKGGATSGKGAAWSLPAEPGGLIPGIVEYGRGPTPGIVKYGRSGHMIAMLGGSEG